MGEGLYPGPPEEQVENVIRLVIEKFDDLIGSPTRFLPAFSIVPQKLRYRLPILIMI
jgi:hypothetical protein